MPRSPSIDLPPSRLRVLAEVSAWVAAVILGLFGLVLVFAAWNEGWPVWLGIGLMSPLGLLLLLGDRADEWDDARGDFAGGDFGGGDFGGGSGDGGGG